MEATIAQRRKELYEAADYIASLVSKTLHSVWPKWCPKRRERVWASLGTLWLVMPHLAGASKIWSDARSCIDASFFNNNKSTVATQAVGIWLSHSQPTQRLNFNGHIQNVTVGSSRPSVLYIHGCQLHEYTDLLSFYCSHGEHFFIFLKHAERCNQWWSTKST